MSTVDLSVGHSNDRKTLESVGLSQCEYEVPVAKQLCHLQKIRKLYVNIIEGAAKVFLRIPCLDFDDSWPKGKTVQTGAKCKEEQLRSAGRRELVREF